MTEKCTHCRAPVGHTESGEIRFDSSQYHMDAAKKLSEIAAWKGRADELEEALKRITIGKCERFTNSWTCWTHGEVGDTPCNSCIANRALAADEGEVEPRRSDGQY